MIWSAIENAEWKLMYKLYDGVLTSWEELGQLFSEEKKN